jgi:hypothetical protein
MQAMRAFDVLRLIKPYPVKRYKPVLAVQYQVLVQPLMPLRRLKPPVEDGRKPSALYPVQQPRYPVVARNLVYPQYGFDMNRRV